MSSNCAFRKLSATFIKIETVLLSQEKEIRRKSNGEPLDNIEIPSDAVRKGPAMPSADVLAVLAQREVVIPEADTEQADKEEDAKSIASQGKSNC